MINAQLKSARDIYKSGRRPPMLMQTRSRPRRCNPKKCSAIALFSNKQRKRQARACGGGPGEGVHRNEQIKTAAATIDADRRGVEGELDRERTTTGTYHTQPWPPCTMLSVTR